MQVSPLYWLPSTLSFATVGLLVGGGVYFALRAIENWDKPSATFLNILGMLVIVSGMAFFILPLVFIAVPLSAVLAIIGARFHQRSASNSDSFGEAFSLLMMASLITTCIECLLWMYFVSLNLPYSPPQSRSLERIIAHCFLLLAPVVLTPFLLWLYQNSLLRPGIDRPLAPETNAS